MLILATFIATKDLSLFCESCRLPSRRHRAVSATAELIVKMLLLLDSAMIRN